MACTLKQCAAALLLLAAAAQAVHLDFAAGLNGWQHSDDEKYAGKFELATPEGLSSQALKVSGPRTSVITASGVQQQRDLGQMVHPPVVCGCCRCPRRPSTTASALCFQRRWTPPRTWCSSSSSS
jgi:hypothetical protein